MKKISLLLAILMIALPLVSCSQNTDDAPDGMKLITADNEVVNYKLYVPDDWTPSISTGAVGAYCSNSDTTNVSVMAWNVDSSETLDTWWDKYRKDFDLVFKDFELTSEETTTLGGVTAKKYAYTAKLGEYTYTYVQCACLHFGMVYVMTFTTMPDLYEQHADEFNDVITCFKFD